MNKQNTKVKKFIDFIITQKCTYSCIYCSQSKNKVTNPKNASRTTINSFYNFLKTLDNDYEITITGGEAILHPNFFEIIETIKNLGFTINLITNLSFNIQLYEKIFLILNDKLNRFDISFHLDEIKDFSSTIKKAELFLQKKPKNTHTTFFIPLYMIDEEKNKSIEEIINLAKKYNSEYSFQKIRFLDTYKNKEEEKSTYSSKHSIINSYGKICHAGSKSAVIYEDGKVYRCYSSRFLIGNYIGNINNKDFKLNNRAKSCCKKYCTCPKPYAYNQITKKTNKKEAINQSIKNYLFLPLMLVKNRNIIIEKAKQFLSLTKS